MHWDPSNTYNFLQYTAAKGYPVFGFEVGNELEYTVDPLIIGEDFLTVYGCFFVFLF
jgi:hypothetical protein